MLFKCKVCVAKDAQIQDLKDQITFLRKMVMPSMNPDIHGLEMNKILEGSALPVVDLTEPTPEEQLASSEAMKIMTGNYFEQ